MHVTYLPRICIGCRRPDEFRIKFFKLRARKEGLKWKKLFSSAHYSTLLTAESCFVTIFVSVTFSEFNMQLWFISDWSSICHIFVCARFYRLTRLIVTWLSRGHSHVMYRSTLLTVYFAWTLNCFAFNSNLSCMTIENIHSWKAKIFWRRTSNEFVC